jgi:hypothetical protein
MEKITETLDNIGIKLPAVVALKEHQLLIPLVVVLFIYAV